MTGGTAQSIRSRLLAHARERGDDFSLVLSRYAIERFLYRLSVSPLRPYYCLKGAQLFHLWFEAPHRPTRDADLLGPGEADEREVVEAMARVARIVVDDAVVFDSESVTAEAIREETRYGGLRVRVTGALGRARCPVQLDIGFGDAVEPAPEEEDYPTLLTGMPAPRLLVYPRAAVMSEKLEAMVHLGMANSRMKDYYDLVVLCREGAVDTPSLARAIVATFGRRGTPVPEVTPLGLSDGFATERTKQAQWKGFLNRNGLDAPTLADAIAEIRAFTHESLRLAREAEENHT